MAATGISFDEGFFTRVFKSVSPDGPVKIVEFSSKCISAKGQNFQSDLYRCTVRYTVSQKNGSLRSEHCVLFVKTEPFNAGTMVAVVRGQGLFQIELQVLRDVLPRIEEIADCQIGPKLFYGSSDPAVIVMEDLSKEGFIMKDRQKGLPLGHCELVIERLAKLHAASVVILEKDPESIKSVDGGVLSSKCPKSYMRLVETGFASVCEAIESWEHGRSAQAMEKLNRLKGTIRERCNNVYSYDDDEFCVLNHGDCWVNNIMFKENEQGQPVDLRLVDYQLAVYSSPVIDLMYFLNICPEHEIKYDKDEHFLELYLTTLSEAMKSMGCKTEPPTVEKLKAAIHKRRIYAVFAAFVLYLRMIANKEDTEDFEHVLVKMSGETKMDVFKNPSAVKAAKKMIPVMEERGYLD